MWHFISGWVFGGMWDVGLCLDFVFLGWGVYFLNWVLFRGWGWFDFDFSGDYFLLREFFLLSFLFVLWWNFINICITFTHSFSQFFVYCGEV